MISERELKPCLLCGSDVLTFKKVSRELCLWMIKCDDCLSGVTCIGKKKTRDTWNFGKRGAK